MDLNPSTKNQLNPDVEFLEQDCNLPWPYHRTRSIWALLATSSSIFPPSTCFRRQATLAEAFRCLKPNGRLVALGPNIKYLAGDY